MPPKIKPTYTDYEPTRETGGLYVLTPDRKVKPPYKIGYAIDFRHRFCTYRTAFYRGIQIPAYLIVDDLNDLLYIFGEGTKSDPYTTRKSLADNKFIEAFLSFLEQQVTTKIRNYMYECRTYRDAIRKRCEWYDVTLKDIICALVKVMAKYSYVTIQRKSDKRHKRVSLRVGLYGQTFSSVAKTRAYLIKQCKFDLSFINTLDIRKRSNSAQVTIGYTEKSTIWLINEKTDTMHVLKRTLGSDIEHKVKLPMSKSIQQGSPGKRPEAGKTPQKSPLTKKRIPNIKRKQLTFN